MAVCTDSGSFHIVEDVLNQHKLYHIPKLHKKMIRSVQFTTDGSRALSGSDDQEIKMVDLNQMKVYITIYNKCIRTFAGHTGGINQVDVNPTD